MLNFKDLVIVIFHALTMDKREGTKQKVKGQAFKSWLIFLTAQSFITAQL